jgi:DNA repair protein RecO (recombination protein O)
MPPIVSDALVLKTYKVGETSKLAVLLTRERGKLRAIAKGARGAKSRYRGALETLNEVRVGLHGRQGAELLRLGDCELLRSSFPALGRGCEAGLVLSYFAELLDAFEPEGAADDAVYRLGRAVVIALEEGESQVMVMARYLEAWLLRLHGIYPPLDRCASCGARIGTRELPYDGASCGFVCSTCRPASGPVLSAASRAFIAEIFRRPPSALAGLEEPGSEIRLLHRHLITHHLERALNSTRVMDELGRGSGG